MHHDYCCVVSSERPVALFCASERELLPISEGLVQHLGLSELLQLHMASANLCLRPAL